VLKQSFRLEEPDQTTGLTLDLPSLRNTYSALFSLPELPFNSALINALTQLSDDLLIGTAFDSLKYYSIHSLKYYSMHLLKYYSMHSLK